MKHRTLTALAVAALVAVTAGCSSDEAAPATEATTTTSSPLPTTDEPTPEPTTAEPTTAAPTEVAPVDPPAECLEATSTTTEGDPIAAVAQTAALPETVSNAIGTQVIHSTKEPGMSEAVVRICSEPLSPDELVDIATSIGATIYADPAHETLSVLVVTSWVPDGAGSIETSQSIRADDYQSYLWDNTSGALDAAWS